MIHRLQIKSDHDITICIGLVRSIVARHDIDEVNQQKVIVSVSELLRNVLDHGGGDGIFTCEYENNSIKVSIEDKGPGIASVEKALGGEKSLQSKGLGLGLSSVKRLMDEVEIITSRKGTKVFARKKF